MRRTIVGCTAFLIAGAVAGRAWAGEPPWVQTAKRWSVETDILHETGTSTAIDGGTLVAGAPVTCCLQGRAHIFEWVPRFSLWRETKTLRPTIPGDKHFGSGVTVSGDTIAVRAAAEVGFAVYLFERDAGGEGQWGEVGRFALEEAGPIVLEGSLLAVGAPLAEVDGQPEAGAVDLFERASAGLWRHRGRLTASDGEAEGHFGEALAASGDRLLVGAPGSGELGAQAGAVYLFEPDETGRWAEAGKLLAADGGAGVRFGSAVGVDGATAIVGAEGDGDRGDGSGSAYLFEREPDGIWRESRKLLAADGGAGDGLGSAVAIAGDLAVAGAPAQDVLGLEDAGAAYIFERDLGGPGTWGEAAKITDADDLRAGDRFGESMATDGRTVVAGIPFDDERDANDSGAIALFARALPFAGEICIDPITFVDGVELTIEGNLIRGSWRNYDGEGTDAPLVGIIRDGLPQACNPGPAKNRDDPQNPVKAYAACFPEFGCMVGGDEWYFVFDGMDGTYDLGHSTGGILPPPGACGIDDVRYQILMGPCPFRPQGGGRTSTSLIR